MKNLLNKRAGKTNSYSAERSFVQGGLSVTPSEMLQATRNGIPISSQLLNDSMFNEGEVSRLTDVPFELRRGIDAGDIYQYQQESRAKVNKAKQAIQNNAN